MKYLFRVKRTFARQEWVGLENFPGEVGVIGGEPIDPDVVRRELLVRHDVFDFESNREDHAMAVLKEIATRNPGCEVEMYRMEKVGQCPAGDFTGKRVDADGSILPLD